MLVPAACAAFCATKSRLAPATRRTYHYELARFAGQFEERDLHTLTLAELEDWLACLPPGLAHNLARRLRTFYRWASRRIGCPRLEPLAPPYRRPGFLAWTEADALAYRRRWPQGSRQRHIFEASLATGLRRSDLAGALWPAPATELIRGLTQKTGAPIHLRPDPALDYGPPLKPISLGLAFRLWARAAGVHKPLHGLRKLAAQRAAEAGCTGPELCALFGWASLRIAEVYIRTSPALAQSALAKLAR